MQVRILEISHKKLVGMHRKMSFSADETFLLWRGFMHRRKEISNTISTDLISMKVLPPDFSFKDPTGIFEKWAAVEVDTFNAVPDGMETYTMKGGRYAVFPFKGLPANAGEFFRYIFTEWLPASGYSLDEREHFEVLGEKFNKDSEDSEEEIWVPIK